MRKPLELEAIPVFNSHIAFRIIHQDEDYIPRGSAFYDKDSGIHGGSSGPHCLFTLHTRGYERKHDYDVMLVTHDIYQEVTKAVEILNNKIMNSSMWKINNEK